MEKEKGEMKMEVSQEQKEQMSIYMDTIVWHLNKMIEESVAMKLHGHGAVWMAIASCFVNERVDMGDLAETLLNYSEKYL